jgi:hypothetical protein
MGDRSFRKNKMRILRIAVFTACMCAAVLAGMPGRQAQAEACGQMGTRIRTQAEACGYVETAETCGNFGAQTETQTDASELTAEARADAMKVVQVIEKIQGESGTASPGGPRSIAVTERELNAYIAHRIETEKEDILTDLRLKLFPDNRIEGLAVLDLRGRKLPAFIKPAMNIVFAGVLESRPGEARIRFESLYLEQQRIQTALLDLVIATVSELEGTEPVRLDDWYELPYGILGLEAEQGRLVASY